MCNNHLLIIGGNMKFIQVTWSLLSYHLWMYDWLTNQGIKMNQLAKGASAL